MTSQMMSCICGEINARHCPVHNEPPQSGGMKPDEEREAFEMQYRSGDDFSDAISLARREDGDYEQALARMCYKWFLKGITAKRPTGFHEALQEAKARVSGSPLFKRFISGTPLENDIPVWIAEASAKATPIAASEQQKVMSEEEAVEVMATAHSPLTFEDGTEAAKENERICHRRAYRALLAAGFKPDDSINWQNCPDHLRAELYPNATLPKSQEDGHE